MNSLKTLVLSMLPWHILASQIPLLVYDALPEEVWRVPFSPIGPGNGAFLSPDEDLLAVVTASGRVRAYDPLTSNVLWTFTPPIDPNTASCTSGIQFVETLTETYLAYAVKETVAGTTTSRIYGINYDSGLMFFETSPLVGEAVGSPQATRDGRYLAITHNENQLGYFSFLDTDAVSLNASLPLEPTFEYQSALLVFNETTPFSELGYYRKPDEGYYGSSNNNGNNNDNDLFIWITDTNTDVLNPNNNFPMAGQGQMYVFQLPQNYDHSGTGLEVIPIGPVRGYQASGRPILTNGGKSMYWSMVRGEVRAWDEQLFSRGHTARNSTERGNPPHLAALAAPSLNRDSSMVFGPGPSNIVWSSERNLEGFAFVETDDLITSRVLVTVDDQFVIYGTRGGSLTMSPAHDLSQVVWQVGTATIQLDSIQGEMARDSTGTMIFVTTNDDDVAGAVVAMRIASEAEPPSLSPSSFPSVKPSLRPSHVPSGSPSKMPTAVPSLAPSFSTEEPTMGIEFLEVPTNPPAGNPQPNADGNDDASPTPAATNPANDSSGAFSKIAGLPTAMAWMAGPCLLVIMW